MYDFPLGPRSLALDLLLFGEKTPYFRTMLRQMILKQTEYIHIQWYIRMCIYVCKYIYMYVYIYRHITYWYVCIIVNIQICIYIYIFLHIYTLYIYTCKYIYIYICIYTQIWYTLLYVLDLRISKCGAVNHTTLNTMVNCVSSKVATTNSSGYLTMKIHEEQSGTAKCLDKCWPRMCRLTSLWITQGDPKSRRSIHECTVILCVLQMMPPQL